MWIRTYNGILVNADKLASIQRTGTLCSDGTMTYCIYGTGTINYLGNYDLDKNAICIFKISDTNKKKVEYVYNHVVKKLIDSFSRNIGFICIRKITEKYSLKFDEMKE